MSFYARATTAQLVDLGRALLPSMRAVFGPNVDEHRLEAEIKLALHTWPGLFANKSGQLAPTAFSTDAQGNVTGEQAKLLFKRILGDGYDAEVMERMLKSLAESQI